MHPKQERDMVTRLYYQDNERRDTLLKTLRSYKSERENTKMSFRPEISLKAAQTARRPDYQPI